MKRSEGQLARFPKACCTNLLEGFLEAKTSLFTLEQDIV